MIKLIYNHFPEMTEKVRREAGKIALAGALNVERYAKQSMRGPKHGRTYRRGAITRKRKKGPVVVGYKFHRASAPGEAPAVDTGKLINSIETSMYGETMATVSASAMYAAALEERMNRPFFGPAVDKIKDWLIRQYVDMTRRLRD
jgi:hypothetical protein